jgi:site-specific DNA-methyltransferase (adenine-specific)
MPELLPPQPNTFYEGNCLTILPQWPSKSVDHCIADPPFGIASGRGRQTKKGLGWAFSSHVTMQEEWDRFSSEEFFEFNVRWLTEVTRLVKPNGNILVFGTYHNVYQLGFILQNILNRRILNSITWFKPNAQPNITARMLAESTEQIIWAVNETPQKAKGWTFNYWLAKEMNGGKQMRNLWEFAVTSKKERLNGGHPSQKPLSLVERLILTGTRPGEIILDCFSGAGTTSVAAARTGRQWLLVESDPKYVAIARARLDSLATDAQESMQGENVRRPLRIRQPSVT